MRRSILVDFLKARARVGGLALPREHERQESTRGPSGLAACC